jgi:hypothetical protein
MPMYQKTRGWCGLIFAAVIALTVGPTGAQEKVKDKQQHVAKTMKPTHHRSRAVPRSIAPQQQIACTMLGCNPVPAGCHPEPQRRFSGMTTGYDAVVCP